MLPYEFDVLLEKQAGRFYLLWRRQGHKTTTLARRALHFMMRNPGGLVTFASATLLVGSELIRREGQVMESVRETIWRDAQALQAAFSELGEQLAAESGGKLRVETNAMHCRPDDVAMLFEAQRLQARVWHSKTVCSRTQIIAPNPVTARSWSGCVIIDEAGHIAALDELLEAMEPIMSADPAFRLIMAGTPPNDDAHFSYQLTQPPEGATFTPSPRGHWYVSRSGLLVHRVDSWDAAAAGLETFDSESRAPVTPEQHRAKALDRDAWDRNYALVFKPGGSAAVTLNLLQNAMARGRSLGLFSEDEPPPGWRDFLGHGPVALGFDPATTERRTSNPSAIAVIEQVQDLAVVRLLVVFKTADPEASRAVLREVLDLGPNRRARRLCIDATNERFFAAGLKQELAGRVPCELVVASEKIARAGGEMTMKTFLGGQLVRHIEDNRLALPDARYVQDDFRLVVRDRGGFENQLDRYGRHGDTFDAVKLALHGLLLRGGGGAAGGGPGIDLISLGPSAAGSQSRATGWKNPYLRQIERGGHAV